jgi:hypothetical protein
MYRNAWKSERWMTLCIQTCWWRQEHQMFVVKFNSGYFGRHDWKPHSGEIDEYYIYVNFYLVVLNSRCAI